MFTNKRYVVWAGMMVGLLSQGSWANNRNFKNAAEKSGCASIITNDGVEACRRLSEAKDVACNRPSTCELDRQERWATEYSELLAKWPSMSDSDKDRSKREIRALREKLENGRAAATVGATVARECLVARDAVQRYFEYTAIPLTEGTRNELVSERKTLVEKFNETKQKREEAKKKYDDKPNDDSLRREWEGSIREGAWPASTSSRVSYDTCRRPPQPGEPRRACGQSDVAPESSPENASMATC